MSQEDDSNEREDRTVELSGIELRALRESAELTALTRSAVQKIKEGSSEPDPKGLEEGTVPKSIGDHESESSEESNTKELPILVDEPPDPADISDPTRSIDRSSLKEMIKAEVKRSVGVDAKTGILRKGALPQAGAATETEQKGDAAKKTPSLALPPIFSAEKNEPDDTASEPDEEPALAALEDPSASSSQDLATSPESAAESEETSASALADVATDDAPVDQEEGVNDTPDVNGLQDVPDVNADANVLAEGEEPGEPLPNNDALGLDLAFGHEDEIEIEIEEDPAADVSTEWSSPEPAQNESSEQALSVAPETSIEVSEQPRKKLGFVGVLVGLALALVGGGAALMIPAFKAIGAGAALAGIAIAFISVLGMRD